MASLGKQASDYDQPIRVSAKAAVIFSALAGCLYWMWINEAETGVSQWGKVTRIYRTTDPQHFALSHNNTLIESALAGSVAVILLGYLLFCMIRRWSLRQGR
ncbi:hypothetical protein LMG29739_06228 [Paraburkholderia solisilvae]|uniref:Uncharacterized protein n=1 Tax=Paraburkholderia solisilvae TaxID=624376 RepID=A0A6J5F4L2_9BURK|nr:hypothetical protein LMG29739_06228 [Paraburkholderia solisilvae]